jgi:hypothetical protein
MVLGDPARELEATSTSGLPVMFAAQGPCEVVDGRLLQATGAGLCAVTAGQPGDPRYAAADEVQRIFRIGRAPQRITFPLLEDMLLGGPPVKLSAVASSELPVAYGARGSCEVDASDRLQLTRTGLCTVTAFQAGDADWAPAADVARTFTVVAPSGPSLVPGEPARSPPTTG